MLFLQVFLVSFFSQLNSSLSLIHSFHQYDCTEMMNYYIQDFPIKGCPASWQFWPGLMDYTAKEQICSCT